MGEDEHPRAIRSFVTRSGRITEAQERALVELWPKYGVEFIPQPLDPVTLFGRDAPRILEIGFGNGENLLALAAAQPGTDCIGIDVHRPGVGRLLLALETHKLTNVRVICHDAVEVLERQIPAGFLREILILFPDPWPKKRHHKRRLLQAAFTHALARRLQHGGYLHVATDWAPYAEDILATLRSEPLLVNRADGFAERPPWRPQTKFEARGARLGHAAIDLVFSRR